MNVHVKSNNSNVAKLILKHIIFSCFLES